MSHPRLSQGISVSEFARRAKCAPKQVRRAIEKGLISKNSDDSLDPAQVDGAWRKPNRRTTLRGWDNRVGQQGGTTEVVLGAGQSSAQVSAATDRPQVATAADLDDRELTAFADRLLAGQFETLPEALRIKENALALKHLLAVRREAGELIEVGRAEAILFEAARQARDAWLGFSTRIGPLLAADLDVPPDRLVVALEDHVRAQLERIGDPDPMQFKPEDA